MKHELPEKLDESYTFMTTLPLVKTINLLIDAVAELQGGEKNHWPDGCPIIDTYGAGHTYINDCKKEPAPSSEESIRADERTKLRQKVLEIGRTHDAISIEKLLAYK